MSQDLNLHCLFAVLRSGCLTAETSTYLTMAMSTLVLSSCEKCPRAEKQGGSREMVGYSSGEGLLVMLVLSIWFDWLYFTLRLVWGGLEFCSALAQGRGAEDTELV